MTVNQPYPEKCLHHIFEEYAQSNPENIAVIFEGENITYKEINLRSNQLAWFLKDKNIKPETPVGVFIHPSVEMIVSLLGILKAGCAYLPLDPAYPQNRIESILSNHKIPFIITSRNQQKKYTPSFNGNLLIFEKIMEEDLPSTDSPNLPCSPYNLAYVIFTSGSEGDPKGVMGLHKGMVNRLQWQWKKYPFKKDEKACLKTSLNFIDSITEIMAPLFKGVPLVIVPESKKKDIRQLLEIMEDYEITRIVLVPSLLKTFLTAYPDVSNRLKKLIYCVSSGEVLTPETANLFLEKLPQATLINLYGSAEISGDVSFFEIKDRITSSKVPIGYPIDNTNFLIVDEDGQPVPSGEKGEIYVSGYGLARGYLNQPDLTSGKFVQIKKDNSTQVTFYKTGDIGRINVNNVLEYLGRIDRMIKIRGHRIEPSEIEYYIDRHPEVHSSVVIDYDSTNGKKLVAYLVLKSKTELSVPKLLLELNKDLPAFMVPDTFVFLNEIPKNANGKTDYASLPPPEPNKNRTKLIHPRTSVEKTIAEIWKKLLGINEIGIHDNFFDLGGDSLLSLQMIVQIEQELNVNIPSTFYQNPTLINLALLIEGSSQQRTVFKSDIEKKSFSSHTKKSKNNVAAFVKEFLESVAFTLPYFSGLAWLKRLYQNSLFIKLFCKNQNELIQSFLKEIKTEINTTNITQKLFISNTIFEKLNLKKNIIRSINQNNANSNKKIKSRFWKDLIESLQNLNKSNSIFQLSGIENILSTKTKNQSVILVTYHSTLLEFIKPIVNNLDFPQADFAAIGDVYKTWQQRSLIKEKYFDDGNSIKVSSELMHKLYKVLANKGVVIMAGDGKQGKNFSNHEITGRTYQLRTGFAELAVLTNSVVIPVTCELLDNGKILTSFYQAINFDAPLKNHEQKVEYLMSQYVGFLNDCWLLKPDTLTFERIQRHVKLSKP